MRPGLEAAGWRVRGMSRSANRARRRWPELDWVEADVDDEASLRAAFDGCAAALYLVHGMSEGPGFRRRERAAAERFARLAAEAGLSKIVYLGGVAPAGRASPHLASRLDVGERLRSGPVPALELRASMIVGHGSLSWLIVRDLAARLPVMVLPRWLESRTQPVAIDDVATALVRAVDLPLEGSAWFDLPGPRILSGREILELTAREMGLHRPLMLEVPLLTPRLSSLWIRFVTRADWAVAREVVIGLTSDLIASDDRFWRLVEHPDRMRFDEAVRKALAAERSEASIGGAWGTVERVLARVSGGGPSTRPATRGRSPHNDDGST